MVASHLTMCVLCVSYVSFVCIPIGMLNHKRSNLACGGKWL